MGKNTEQSRDRLALLLGLILILAAIGLVVTVVLILKKVGSVELVKGLSIQWSSIKLGLVVAAVLLAPAGFMLAALGWRRGVVAVNVEAMMVLCLVLLAIVSVVSARYYYREDWTKVGKYGLSDQTIQMLNESLSKPLTITVLATPSDVLRMGYRPVPLGPEGYGYLLQMLKEYQSYTGKVEVVPLDVDQDREKVLELAKKLDIKERPALIIQYGDKHEELDLDAIMEVGGNMYSPDPSTIQRKLKVEEAVTGAIMKLTEEKPTEICFTTGHGERSPEDYEDEGLADIRKYMEKANYKVRRIDLGKESIPEDCVLVVAGPKKAKFRDVEIEAIRNFLTEDIGKLLVMADPVSEAGCESGLAELLMDYDVTLRQDATIITLQLGRRGLGLSPLAVAYCDPAAADNDIVAKLKNHGFMLFMACPMETKPSAPGEPPNSAFDAKPILKVTEQFQAESKGKKIRGAWGETDYKEGAELGFDADKGDIGPPLTVGVAIEPKGPPPPNPRMPVPPPPPDTPAGPRIVVIGDSDFASNRYVKEQMSQAALFSNCVAWLAAKKGKLGIPPKDIDARRLDMEAVTGPGRGLMILLFVVVLPTMVGIVLGTVIWVLRRK